MIRILKRVTASAIWDIDGTEVKLQYKKEFPEPVMAEKVAGYRDLLQSRDYQKDNSGLIEMFQLFGGIAFVGIGMAYPNDFLDCFAFYAKQFAVQWAEGEQQLHSKNIGYEYVFMLILNGKESSIDYDFRYILADVRDSQKFCDINEQAFSAYWTEKMKPLMAENRFLLGVASRVGDVRLSKYLMQLPDETSQYLKRLAESYTARRELISLRKLHNFIFGNDSRTSFPNCDAQFLSLLRKTVEDELKHQSIVFIAENRKEMNSHKDIWVLYGQHGVTLEYMTVDFTKIETVSMRNELKCFLRFRFVGSIRTDDRLFIAIIYAANKLCSLNSNLRYFSDVELVDVKMLQATMEDESSQVSIMGVFTACKSLFRYLCSDENESKAPKPYQNPFEPVAFVNVAKYSKGTPYIPACVLDGIMRNLKDLSAVDQLVFQIFCETGMRAKEVSSFEVDCLQKSRYDGAVQLKYIPHKVIKARRRAGVGDYHSVYISPELAKSIEQQIHESADICQQHEKPYVLLHHNNGYELAMYDVSYFNAKINALIKKHNICDESGALWHFTSRQCRKTLVVNMIENGASTMELVYQLGHLTPGTVMKFYAEVRAIKLAELNCEFFRMKFDVILSGEQLTEFTEEERRLLYVDFRLGYRRVELGLCTRKLCDGACKSRSRTVHCVNCPQLCTGKQYLPHWAQLVQAQQDRVNTLHACYQAENLYGYEDFLEFKQESKLLTAYQNVIIKIEESEVNAHERHATNSI